MFLHTGALPHSFAVGALLYALLGLNRLHAPLPASRAIPLGLLLPLYLIAEATNLAPLLPRLLRLFWGVLAGESLFYFLTLPARDEEAPPATLYAFLLMAALSLPILVRPFAWVPIVIVWFSAMGDLFLLLAYNVGLLALLFGPERRAAQTALAMLLLPLEAAILYKSLG